MKTPGISIRTNLGIIIVVMGVLSIVLALTTGEIYRHLALENQRDALARIIELKSHDLLADLEENSRNLGVGQQREPAFRQALATKDKENLVAILNNQFHQYFVTADVIVLEKIYLFDEYFSLLAQTTEGAHVEGKVDIICPGLLDRAKRRHGASRLRPLSELCLYGDKSYFGVLQSVGGLRIAGYLLVITDPAHFIKGLEKELGMPLQLSRAGGGFIYESPHWPDTQLLDRTLVAKHVIHTHSHEPALEISVAFDLASLNTKLQHTRYVVMLAAVLVTVLAIVLALLVFQKTTYMPLLNLTRQLHLVRHDRKHLGEMVRVQGNREVAELAENFNAMSLELRSLYASLENLAYTDSLTELPNRTLFHDRLNQIVNLSDRIDGQFGVFMLDLDRFKEINDTLGHQVGDDLLKQVSLRLLDTLRKSDTIARIVNNNTIARLGGDEFAAILPTVSEQHDAIIVAQKIHQAMEQPFLIDGHSLQIAVSIGIVLYPEHGTDGKTLLQHADIAMYEAKQSQQDYAIYDTTRDHNSLAQLTMVSELRHAIHERELKLFFQPKIDLSTGQVTGVEALARWQHPQYGLIQPDDFVPLAEHTGLIKPLTQWVITNAVAACHKIHRAGYRLHIASNISVRNLYEPELLDYLSATLDHHSLDGRWLCLELTESAIMVDSQRALMILQALDARKIMLAIDDFGTGYSSLSHLKKLPVDEIKIDRSFVVDMLHSENDAIIVQTTIDLAHNMGLVVTAEGVENPEIFHRLKELGCDLAQGFYIEKPMTMDELLHWLATSPWSINSEAAAATNPADS